MKRSKKNKILIAGGIIFIIIFSSILFSISNNVVNTEDVCIEGDKGGVICFLKDSGLPFAVTSNKMGDVVVGGESIRVAENLEYTQSDLPFKSARVFLFKNCKSLSDSCIQIDSYNIANTLNNLISKDSFFGNDLESKYIFNAITLNAPEEAGDYWVTDSLIGQQGALATSAGFGFSVKSDIVCSDNVVGSWLTYNEFGDGSGYVEKKSSIIYGDAPDCDAKTINIFKTICSDGYLAKGTSSSVSNEETTCEIITPAGGGCRSDWYFIDGKCVAKCADDSLGETYIDESDCEIKNEITLNPSSKDKTKIYLYIAIAIVLAFLIFLIFNGGKKK